MCILGLSTTPIKNISHSKRNRARCDQKCKVVFMQSTRYSCQILIKLDSALHIFKKYSNMNFRENLSCGSRVVSRRQMDGQIYDEANSRLSQSCENASTNDVMRQQPKATL